MFITFFFSYSILLFTSLIVGVVSHFNILCFAGTFHGGKAISSYGIVRKCKNCGILYLYEGGKGAAYHVRIYLHSLFPSVSGDQQLLPIGYGSSSLNCS